MSCTVIHACFLKHLLCKSVFIAVKLFKEHYLELIDSQKAVVACVCLYSRGQETPGKFSAIFYKEDNFCDLLFASLHIKPLLKGVYSKKL